MQYIAFYRSLAVLVLTMVFSLAACGNTSQSYSNGNSSGTPKGPNTPQPTSGTVILGQVKLATDKSHYALNEDISVIITNGLSTPIFASAYYTNCTLVLLEWNNNNAWLPRGRCPSAVTHVIPLKPSSATLQQLSPVLNTFKPTNTNRWQPGTYRITFFYSMYPDEQSTQGISVHSETFTIS